MHILKAKVSFAVNAAFRAVYFCSKKQNKELRISLSFPKLLQQGD